MAKKTITLQHVTREILKEEISASEQRLGTKIADLDVKVDNVENRLDTKIDNVEKRLDEKIDSRFDQLDTKIETTAQSLKEYTDIRFNQLDVKIDTTTQSLKDYTDSRFTQLDTKLTKYFELMMQTFTEAHKGIHKILSSHEERISVLEGRGPQPDRI